MQPHENLFNYFGKKSEVYQKLQEDYLRDQRQSRWYQGACILFLVGAGLVPNPDWKTLLFILSAGAILQYFVLFIELSNRNFLMHAIDWMEASKSNGSGS